MKKSAEIFPVGGKKVNVILDGFTVETDLPLNAGGENAALDPFRTFLTSIAACSGLFLKNYCDTQQISTEGMRLFQHFEFDDRGMLIKTISEVHLPPSFPENKRKALENTLKICKVKKHLDPKIISEVVLK